MNIIKDQNKESKIFEMQDDILRIKKQFGNKQLEWKRQKSSMQQHIEILHLQIIESKHRQSNLKKINQALSEMIKQFDRKDDLELKKLLQSIKNYIYEPENNGTNTNTNEKQFKKYKEQYEKTMGEKYREQIRKKQQELRNIYEEKYFLRVKEMQNISFKSINTQKQTIQKVIKKKYNDQIQKLKTQNLKLTQQNNTISQQLTTLRFNYQSNQYTQPLYNYELKTSTLIPTNQTYKQFNLTSKKSLYDHINSSHNVATDLLCQICQNIYPVNLFYEHLQQCKYEQLNNIQKLINKKKQIEQQLHDLSKSHQKSESQQVMYIFSDLNKSKKNQIEKDIKKIIKSINIKTPEKNETNVSIIRYNEDQNQCSRHSKNTILKTRNKKY